jgi:hypothetical protein
LKDFPPKKYAKGAQAADRLTPKTGSTDFLFCKNSNTYKVCLNFLFTPDNTLKNIDVTYSMQKNSSRLVK